MTRKYFAFCAKSYSRAAGISTNALAKLGKNENVNTGVLEKICHALNCQVADIMEITDVEDNCLKREEK